MSLQRSGLLPDNDKLKQLCKVLHCHNNALSKFLFAYKFSIQFWLDYHALRLVNLGN